MTSLCRISSIPDPFRAILIEIVWKPTGNRQEIDRKSMWGTAFGVLRVPDDPTTPGGGPLLVKIAKCIEPFAKVPRKCKFHCGFVKVGVANRFILQGKCSAANSAATVTPSIGKLAMNTTTARPIFFATNVFDFSTTRTSKHS